MKLFRSFNDKLLYIKKRFTENSLDNLLWIVDIFPSFGGFSIFGDSIWAPFWIVHVIIMCHGYLLGCIEYQMNHATSISEYIKSNFNINILILDFSISWWCCMKRTLLKEALKQITLSDSLARETCLFKSKHKQMMKNIKRIVLLFYGGNILNCIFIYLPNRVSLESNYCMTKCLGFGSLTQSPAREMCLFLLAIQELYIIFIILNFQVLLLLLIAHTSSMYQMLASEILLLNETKNVFDIKARAEENIPKILRRHILILNVFNKLKSLYSIPLGINFGINAIFICMFFYIPLKEWFGLLPVLFYSALLFFLYCFLCQRLVNASEEFESAVYCCSWENFELKEKKMIYIMLRQAQKPMQVLAANIIPVNLSTFATTLQFMYKFVTVVKI